MKAYKGICSSDPTIKIWITVSPYGFSAVISTPQGIEYVDKYFMERKDVYIVYNVDTYKNNPYAGIPLWGLILLQKINTHHLCLFQEKLRR
ncbi:MAG: hypothetical protein IPN10_11025 [Saprospiraceae bacterium]|nr:hypothetical protein [Saprospiraceae bacterium]